MMDLFPIRNDEDHALAVREIARLWDAPDDSPKADLMDALATLVDRYERQRYPIPRSTPLETLKFSMEQNGRTQTDLANLLGSRSRASVILNGRRALTLDQIRLLSVKWGIPVGCLIGEIAAA
jgi:HTH-type transcriptional regulator/antitoxin HigA